MTAEEQARLRSFTKSVNDALPIGNSETQLVVQEAVARYLRDRRNLPSKERVKIRNETVDRIVSILKEK